MSQGEKATDVDHKVAEQAWYTGPGAPSFQEDTLLVAACGDHDLRSGVALHEDLVARLDRAQRGRRFRGSRDAARRAWDHGPVALTGAASPGVTSA